MKNLHAVALAVALALALAVPSQALTFSKPLPDLLRRAPASNQTPIPTPVQGCCKHCHKGKACGDSCISRNDACHVGPGCACDG
jgi:hypothetical protein